MELPSGIVTFLFTDIESSMALWTADAAAMSVSLELHDRLMSEEIARAGGHVFTRAGDSFAAVFASTADAVSAARQCQRRLAATVWPGPELQVRMGLHVGDAQLRDDDYFGPTVNLAARVAAAGHGGQIVATSDVVAVAGPTVASQPLGTFSLRGSAVPIELHQVGDGAFPDLRADAAGPLRIAFDDVEIDAAARVIRRSGEVVTVEPQVFDVLLHLIEHRDRLVSREELLDEVWGDQFVSLSALTTRIKQARQALGDDGRTQRYIRNERGRGYQFVGSPMPTSEEPTPRTQAPPADAVETPRRPSGTRILGRLDERRAVADLVASSPLTTVVGPGGVGKTTLVSGVIDDLAAGGRGAVLARLDAVRDGAGLVPAMTTVLGLSGASGDGGVSACAEWLAATGRVLVLDNCEHLLPAVRDFVTELLELAPEVSVLTTSRQPLGLGIESVYRLGPLDLPERVTAADAGEWPCLELFASTAQRSGGMQIASDDEWTSVADLCRRLDGLPLAVELAASRLSTLGLHDLVDGLDDRLDWFRNRDVDSDDRQRSLRSTVEWSFRFLDDDGRRLVAALARFPAGLRLRDVEILAGLLGIDQPADEIVARLVDASVLLRDVDGGEARYTMLETIRQFGLEQLEHDAELGDIVERHLVDHALAVARAERDAWTGASDPRGRSLSRLRAEVPNLRAARELMLEGGDAAAAVEVAVGLCAFTEEASLAELWSWHDIDPTHRPFDDPDVEAGALLLEASAARNRGDIAASRRLAAAAADTGADDWVCGRARHTEAMAAMFSGEPFEAGELWLRSDELIGGCRGRLFAAMAAAFGSDLDRAATLLADCAVEPGDAVPVDLFTNVHLVRGEVARVADTGDAKAEFEQAVDVARTHGLAFSMGIAQVPLVAILEAEGEVEEAAQGYVDLIDLFLRSGTWTQLWTTMRNAARLLLTDAPEVALLICAASERDPGAPALDEAGEAEAAQLRESVLERLGREAVDRIDRRASLVPRVDVVRDTVAALRRLA